MNFKNGTLTLYFEPQFNPVYVRYNTTNLDKFYFEFGANIGLKQTIKIYQSWFVFIHFGAGPHYISIETNQQYKGFLFSDNLGIGISYLLQKNIYLSVGFRLRHLSNAYINLPNFGINTYNYHIGVSWIL